MDKFGSLLALLRSQQMNLPNKLTVGRLFLTAIFVAVAADPLGWGAGWCYTVGLVLFAVASFTDYLDGYWARKYQLVTEFGKLMDPLVDKVLICSAFVMLTEALHPGTTKQVLPGWFTVTVLAREFLVTGLRLVASAQGAVLAADRLGKHKTAWQIVIASYFLTFLASHEASLQWLRPLFDFWWFSPHTLGKILIFIALFATVFSGCAYFWRNRELVFKDM
jgi:CDP-diacylglycerol--glycerol-3-phosphate 3-phosphatidyltransferase